MTIERTDKTISRNNHLWSDYAPLLGLTAVFLCIRLLILFSGVGFYFHEEPYIGSISKVLIDGLSPSEYLRNSLNYRWGGLFFGALTAPFFAIFSPTILVMRFVAMLLSLGSMVLLYVLLVTFFNKKTALIASVIFMLSPPNIVRLSFVGTGGYAEINLFVLLTFCLFYQLFFLSRPAGQAAPKISSPYPYFLFGAVSGFSTFYDYTYLLVLSCSLLFWYYFDKHFFRRSQFWIFIAGALIAFTPWFYYNLTHNWNALFIMRRKSLLDWFLTNTPMESLGRVRNLVIHDIPAFFDFNKPFKTCKELVAGVYYFILAASFAGLFWRQRRSLAAFCMNLFTVGPGHRNNHAVSRESFIIIYALICGFAYAFCGLDYLPSSEVDRIFPYRFIIFLMLPLLIAASVLLANLLSSTRRVSRLCGRTAVFALIMIGLISNAGMVDFRNFPYSSLPAGYNYTVVGEAIRKANGNNINRLTGFIAKIDKKNVRFLYNGLAWLLPDDLRTFSLKEYSSHTVNEYFAEPYRRFAYERLGIEMGRSLVYNRKIEAQVREYLDQAYRPFFYFGLGRGVTEHLLDGKTYGKFLGTIEKRYWKDFHNGIGVESDSRFINRPRQFVNFVFGLDKELQEAIFRGFSQGKEYKEIHYEKFNYELRKIRHSVPGWERRVAGIPEEFRPFCYQRLGIEIGWRYLSDIKGYTDFLRKTDSVFASNVYKGFGIGLGLRFDLDVKGCVLLMQCVPDNFRGFAYEGFGEGLMRRYGCQSREMNADKQLDRIPPHYRVQFYNGAGNASGPAETTH